MAEGSYLPSDMYREASVQFIPSGSATDKQTPEASGSKRSTAEPLEQSTTKMAKLTARVGHEAYSEIAVKEEPDERDESIGELQSTLEKAQKEIARLEKELEEAEDKRDEYSCRMHELQARESKRIEKENLVETTKHAEMKLAAKNQHAQLKADYQRKEKIMKEDCRNQAATKIAKNNAKWEKQMNETQTKHQNTITEYKREIKMLKDDHKEELKDIKENHREEIKQLKPEHNRAMRDKNNELKAKEKNITQLEKSVQSMGALVAEKETLANQVEKEKSENEKLRKTFKRFHEVHEEVQGQYISKLEHEGQKWQIQHDQVDHAKTQLMSQQRSIFALRGELNYKTQKIQALERQLQNVQSGDAVSTADASDQTSTDNIYTAATGAGE